jgi:Zn-dependent alcohol dehydrogenase
MRSLLLGAVGAGCAAVIAACGGAQYTVEVNSAASRVEEAKALGADQLAPYEYYYAKEHLQQAQVEAAEASYSDATNLAEEAEAHAQTAIELTQKALRARP